jgi:hypothetical protein
LTAVARQKDPRRKAKHVFALFSPERNFHIEAPNDREAQEWVELIRREARIDEEEEESLITLSPSGPSAVKGQRIDPSNTGASGGVSGTSGSEPEIQIRKSRTNIASPETMHSARKPSHALQSYSGNEHGSYSDFSDTGLFPDSSLSLSQIDASAQTTRDRNAAADAIYSPSRQRPAAKRNVSQVSTVATEERVVYHGYLHLLKSKNGIRQWKAFWAVLRPKSLALYKNEEEYSALLIMPFPTILDAVDIDPQSKTKKYCMQVITEERNYRFCAPNDDELAKWLGAFRSLLVKRKEGEKERREREANALAERERPTGNENKGKGKDNTVTFLEEGLGKTGIGTSREGSTLSLH